MNLTKEQARIVLLYLEGQFSWLCDPEEREDICGADLVDQLCEIHQALSEVAV